MDIQKRVCSFRSVLYSKLLSNVKKKKKKRAASFLNGFKNIPGKECVKRVHNNYAFVNVGNRHTRKTPHTNEECFNS